MNKQEELAFETVLQDAIEQARELDYHPNRFVGMIASKGGFQTVKDIVASGKPSEGFDKLALHSRIDLTCESIIVETEWRRFFDDDLLAIAEKRLSQYGHKWRAFAQTTDATISQPPSWPHEPQTVAATSTDDFIPPTQDQRETKLRETYCRPGQAKFRAILIKAYGARRMISGESIEEALEAAHICAYRGDDSHHPQNGLLLRADLHNLFDRFMFSVEPHALTIRLSSRMKSAGAYKYLEGTPLQVTEGQYAPSRAALQIHWNAFLNESTQM